MPLWSRGKAARNKFSSRSYIINAIRQDNIILAYYGYSDGSGDYFITVDTDKCNACGDCVKACPAHVFTVVDEDPNDPFNERPVVIVSPEKSQKLRYECGPCKPPSDRPPLPCVAACNAGAISQSW